MMFKDKDLQRVRDILDLITCNEIKHTMYITIRDYLNNFKNGLYKGDKKNFWRYDCILVIGALDFTFKLGYFKESDYIFVKNYLMRYGDKKRIFYEDL